MVSKLKSLRSLGAYDGEKHTADIPRDVDLPKCKHKNAKIVSSSELKCKCGAAWTDTTSNIIQIHKLLTS